MLKYANYDIVCQEVPGEVSLAINITGCPCRCPECHSRYLWADKGQPLNCEAVDQLVDREAEGVTCIAFMGGDASPAEVDLLARHIRQSHPRLKVAWYSGRTIISNEIDPRNFNYIKVGPYISHLGPLNARTTNQRFYRVSPSGELEDETHLFWRK